MQRLPWTKKLMFLAPVLAVSVLALGCPKSDDVKPGAGDKKPTGETKPPAGDKKEVTALPPGDGTVLKGRVTIEGTPDIDKLNKQIQEAMEKNAQDKGHCLSDKAPASAKEQQAWKIKDKAVANVVVWLRPADSNTFFEITDKVKAPEKVVIDQPYCAFEPHVLTLFSKQYDPTTKKVTKGTGQKFVVKNSATIAHNTSYQGSAVQGGDNLNIPQGTEKELPTIAPDYKQPVNISCKIHPWMNAYAWVFDHPYAAVTKDDGTFEIKNVPEGKVKIVAWHEVAGFLTKNGAAGEEITLGKENTKDFTVKAP